MAQPFFLTAMLSLALLSPIALFGDCGMPEDADGDGYAADVDCDDTDPTINPGAEEPCECDGIDQDCNGIVDDFPCDFPVCEGFDADGDGFASPEDCDDSNPEIYPGAGEPCECNNVDDDCNGIIDDFDCDMACPTDRDGDGYPSDVDCNDNDPKIHPDQEEPCQCNSIDENCNGQVDDFLCDVSCDGQQVGDACGGDYGECAFGLACCYPCGIEGCGPNICHIPCYEDWCSGGCPLYP